MQDLVTFTPKGNPTVFQTLWASIIRNPLLWVDFYNISHWYLKCNQDWEVSHIYNRSWPMILFGFNELITEWFNNLIVTKEMVDDAVAAVKEINPDAQFPYDMWMRVVNEFGGRVPVEIQALPDGTWVPQNTPFAQIRNTVQGFGELVSWFEIILLKAFFPSACATRAKYMRQYLDGDNPTGKPLPTFRFHDFGFRGHPDVISAYWGTKGWMLSLVGTDNVAAARWCPDTHPTSIAAEAHKVLQQFDEGDFEGAKYGIKAAHDHGQKILAIVIDTYDAWRFINEYVVPLAQYAQTLNMNLVFRPDSGNTVAQVIAMWQLVRLYHLDNVSFIIGEGMTFEKCRDYDYQFFKAGVDITRVAYGIGGGFFKEFDRDYLGWSMKTAYSNGAPRMKFAEPYKQSIPNAVELVYDDDGDMYVTYRQDKPSLYKTVWSYNPMNGLVCNPETYEEIKSRVAVAPIAKQKEIAFGSDVIALINQLEKQYGVTRSSYQGKVIKVP